MPSDVMITPSVNPVMGLRRHTFDRSSLSKVPSLRTSQLQANLLANSLTNRIKTHTVNKPFIQHGGQSDLLHFASLNKERNSLFRGGRRLTSRAREDRNIRHQDRMTRQNEWKLLSHADLYTQNGVPEVDSGSVKSEALSSRNSVQSLPVQRLSLGESDDQIGMEKRGGIFQSIHMFAPQRYKHNVHESPFKSPIIEYEEITIPQSGCISTYESKRNRRKDLRVTFSTSNSVVDWNESIRRADDNLSSRTKSRVPKISYISDKDRIPEVGVAWDITPTLSHKTSVLPGQLSRDLHPVTSGMNKEETVIIRLKIKQIVA
ncbi:hypothetical protein LOTGIDRAFT_161748 [Lottia gigantea]|uniref:Uncharacterized protein n=1 Tax=Lottia gigantea TaxID=225164 RepID=V4AEQ3_LOTGI|nr:hypothetical protein LOTGIDRAFT_161748 [Lottia gigantea]ESO93635.1 hypothetical protein LOTGIDRAFT_161748 [Lottia gigantea]